MINLKAAKKLLFALNPVRYEADMWWIFRFRRYLNVYCVIPHLINTNDENKSNSALEEERAKVQKKEKTIERNYVKVKNPIISIAF